MEILRPYPNTFTPESFRLASCAYIRVESEGLWLVYCSMASTERRLGVLRLRHPG